MINNERVPSELTTHDFYYDLPEELIAQTPIEKRDNSRLMIVNRNDNTITHSIFHDIIDHINENDVLVINNSKVIPARMYGLKEDTGASIEVVMLKSHGLDTWETLVRPGKKCKPGTIIIFGDGILRATVKETLEGGNRLLEFVYDKNKYESIYNVLDIVGNMPLPPYITEKLEDKTRYQTVYAKHEGSAAAPTAGLHFTEELLDAIRKKGAAIVPVMLHVGLGTFRPVKVDKLDEHIMHTEYITVTKESADIINERRKNGGRIIAVGTTSCRTLESASDENGIVHPIEGDTGIFIYPGYKFKATDALITNFHLPESTLLMLVSALAGKDRIMDAYAEAIKEKYRFFSFGDAMLIQ
jgi:S-adenosylmethionine:tRNA ribosyltransferase-isomerase